MADFELLKNRVKLMKDGYFSESLLFHLAHTCLLFLLLLTQSLLLLSSLLFI